ncbi:hypothetical protein DFH09DRAFT_1396586 [Mycena vulgaris]|nr:hypothetical protein DFH09DRAFT_1396586 [Mycena vulgaris]
MPSLFHFILLCYYRRIRTHDTESSVIPNETSRLLAPPSPAPVVDHQKLSERLAGIVRAKEGCVRKMVSVSSRAPFTIVSSHPSPSSTPPTNGTTTISRRPPVLTMTPTHARSQGSNLHLTLYVESRSSSSSGSRASSSRRPQSAHSQSSIPPSAPAASQSSAPASASNRGKALASASAWLGEGASDTCPRPRPGRISGIQRTLTTAGLDGPGLGKSVLSSIFDTNPTKGRFFALALSRLGDTKDTANASLSISEYEPQYAGMHGDAVWLDSGTSNILVCPEIRDRICFAVPGAVLAKNSSIGNQGHWSGDRDVWVVPCNTSASLTVYFGDQPYPIHPLDFMSLSTQVGPDGVNYTICVGRITNGGSITTGKTDATFGDTFLRNVYTVFSFGDNTTSPFVQFLPLTNKWESSQDFISVREQILAKNPPELAPADLIRVFDGPSASTPSSSGQSPEGSSSSSDVPDPSSGSACPSPAGWAAVGNLAAADAASSTDSSTVAKYAPIIIGLLGVNLAILLVLVFLGVMAFVGRSRRTGPAARAPGARYIPARVKDDALLAPSFDEEKRYSDN